MVQYKTETKQKSLIDFESQPEKKGGPYSKIVQKDKKSQVYTLHFEKGYTAIQIAEKIGVNRNTVSDYIRYWNSQIGSSFGEENLGSAISTQLESLQIQRQNLLSELEKQDDIEKRLRIRRLLFDMDQRITGFVLKIAEKSIKTSRFNICYDVSEEEIKSLIMSMSKEARKNETREGLLQRIISLQKCDLEYAESVFNTMRKLGLDLFELKFGSYKNDENPSYNIASFASHRGFLQ